MVDTLILDIKQAMSSILTNGQMEKLHKVLAHYLYDLEIVKKEGTDRDEKENIEYLEAFLSAKHVEGCSRKSLKYYKATIENLFKKIENLNRSVTSKQIKLVIKNLFTRKVQVQRVLLDQIIKKLS